MNGSTNGVTIRLPFHVAKPSRQIRLRSGPRPAPPPDGSVSRVARLLALAHHYRDLLERGAVKDYATLARLACVTRARVTQVMNLLFLAPEIQEEILFLPRTVKGDDPVRERQVRSVALVSDWADQKPLWVSLLHRTCQKPPHSRP